MMGIDARPTIVDDVEISHRTPPSPESFKVGAQLEVQIAHVGAPGAAPAPHIAQHVYLVSHLERHPLPERGGAVSTPIARQSMLRVVGCCRFIDCQGKADMMDTQLKSCF